MKISKNIYQIVFWGILGGILLGSLIYGFSSKDGATISNQTKEASTKDTQGKKEKQQAQNATPAPTVDPTTNIYTFMQGPKAWKSRVPYSGKWGKTVYDGAKFGAFGCGLCCTANIYSSLTPYEASPIDTYKFTKKVTEYEGGQAVGWGYLKNSLIAMGLNVDIGKKPKSYQDFQQIVKNSTCGIMLVSSYDSECYWHDTPGHYVTIFLYDEAQDKVFLGDSGDPEHNRQWIELKKIYKSLKKSSDFQYITILSYDENLDKFKNTSASGKWVRPEP